MMDLLTLAGAVVFVIVLLLAVIRHKSHQVKAAKRRIHTLETHNEMLQQELNHAKTRKQVQTNVNRLSDDDVDSQLQEHGYFRD